MRSYNHKKKLKYVDKLIQTVPFSILVINNKVLNIIHFYTSVFTVKQFIKFKY